MATESLNTETNPVAVLAESGVSQLTFTGRREDGGINLWSPAEVAGEWDEQCRVGRGYGREAADYIRESGDAAMLPAVVRAIVERGSFGGVEVGFFAKLSVEISH